MVKINPNIRNYSVCKLPDNCELSGSVQRVESSKTFKPKEFKLGEERVTSNDFLPKAQYGKLAVQILNHQEKEDKSKWINKLYNQEVSYLKLIQGIQALGSSKEESEQVVDEAIYHSERATNWSIANENYGGLAADSIFLATCLGVLDKALEETDFSPALKTTLNILRNGLTATRGYFQYGYVYGGRNDDEKAMNNYQGEVYGNKTSSIFADLAYIFETKISPIPLLLLGLASKRTQEALTPLLFLPNILWWRVRMPGEIRQDFVTDSFNYLFNKPLALLKVTESIRKIKEIKEKGYLNYPYIQKRLVELIGLDPAKHKLKDAFPELAKLLKTLLTKDGTDSIDAARKIGKFLAPIFGFYGFFAVALGIPLKSALKWLDIESKFINSFAISGTASQQILYFFRIILPEYLQNKMQEHSVECEEVNKLKTQRNRLFYTGIATCSSSIISTLLKLVNIESKNLKLGLKVMDEFLDKGISYYFSKRRELRGKDFRLFNQDLFNPDGTAKIISDKIQNIEQISDVQVGAGV